MNNPNETNTVPCECCGKSSVNGICDRCEESEGIEIHTRWGDERFEVQIENSDPGLRCGCEDAPCCGC